MVFRRGQQGGVHPFWTGAVGPELTARFTVWNGVSINARYRSLVDIRDAIQALSPNPKWALEWLVKAGEGGTYQAFSTLQPEKISPVSVSTAAPTANPLYGQ